MLREFFESEGIFCYGELPLSAVKVWDRGKMDRMEREIGAVESVVIFLIPYYTGQVTTNLSVYAQPRDYHLYLKELSLRFGEYLKKKDPEIRFRGFADSSPIAERGAALAAGLGVLGKNGLILNPRYGSFCFLGEFFLTKAISPMFPREIKTCNGCGACERACPTGAIRDPQRKKCLSFLSQKKHRTEEEEILVKEAFCKWGCDLCQNVCPVNRSAEDTPIPFFREDLVKELTAEAVEAPKEEFSKRAFSWRGRELLRRNLKK